MKTGDLKRFLAALLAAVLAVCLPVSAMADEGHEKAKDAAVSYLKASIADKCPIVTYETEEPLLSVSSYTYESALAALALMSEGEFADAARILDGFADGMKADAEFNDRLRNAYMAGNASTLPGYWNNEQEQWVQDAYQVGTGTKSSCAAAVALLTYHKTIPNESYLNTAMTGINWILANCQDGTSGFTSGYTGWKNADAFTDLTYKSTSDNLWMAAACKMLADATGWSKYEEAASSARRFATETMYSAGDSRFFQGTAEDGATPVTNLVLTDVQALAELCLKNDSGMDNIAMCHTNEGGYSFDNSNTDGSWLEGTAIAALALKEIGETEKAGTALSVLEKNQLPSGSFPEASVPELKTGEEDRIIRNLPSVAPCAWFILAVNDFNPFDGA